MTTLLLTRRRMLAVSALGAISGAAHNAFAASELPKIESYRNPKCGCCEQWAKLLQTVGFAVTMSDDPQLNARKAALGVPLPLAGCHTSLVGDYVLEGHVPVREILRLISEHPNAGGLAVPGMPAGSPGMEVDGMSEAYDVILFKANGTSSVYASY